jgi:hypothetical protein
MSVIYFPHCNKLWTGSSPSSNVSPSYRDKLAVLLRDSEDLELVRNVD